MPRSKSRENTVRAMPYIKCASPRRLARVPPPPAPRPPRTLRVHRTDHLPMPRRGLWPGHKRAEAPQLALPDASATLDVHDEQAFPALGGAAPKQVMQGSNQQFACPTTLRAASACLA